MKPDSEIQLNFHNMSNFHIIPHDIIKFTNYSTSHRKTWIDEENFSDAK